jgi:ribosomal protein S18 acetylase RimI-like enzyme
MLIIDRLHPSNAHLLETFLLVQGGLAAVTEFRLARQKDDWLAHPHTYALIALWGDHPAGLAVAVLVPKADARLGFLFVDELMVLPEYQRRGVATALLTQVEQLAQSFGLAGVRLLARPENDAARALYQRMGFHESASLLCEKRW